MYPESFLPHHQLPTYESFEEVTSTLAQTVIHEKAKNDVAHKRPYLVAVEGPMASGKGTLAKTLAQELQEKGTKVQVISVDHYMNPGAIRKQVSPDPASAYYEYTINTQALAEHVLKPITELGKLKAEVDVFNVADEQRPLRVKYDVDEDTVVIVEGIFVLKRDIRDYYDKAIYYDMSEDFVRKSAASRNGSSSDKPMLSPEELNARMDARYIPGYEMYLREDNPAGEADIVVERARKGFRIAAHTEAIEK